MTTWTSYRIAPKAGGGFHFGRQGLEQEQSAPSCASDTLVAALVATQADLDGDAGVADLIAPDDAGWPPFTLTSAFPRAGSLPLLPAPFLRAPIEIHPGQRKLLKRLQFVSPAVFRRWIRGARLDAYADPTSGKGRFLQDGKVWIAAEEIAHLPDVWAAAVPRTVAEQWTDWREWIACEDDGAAWLRARKVWQAQPVDRVTVDRITAASAVYRIGRTVYAPGCGLWFAVRWPEAPDGTLRARLETLLAHLGDRGLGGERSIGYGQFDWNALAYDLDLPDPDPDGAALTLSRYLPRKAALPGALSDRAAAYRLDAVGGWLGTPEGPARRRRRVHMLTEGSVFKPTGAGPWGRAADVRPDSWDAHPIWRWGYACPVGVQTPKDDERRPHA
jgi:CRISPR-associated protein Csm4